jgi:hypothetical protein
MLVSYNFIKIFIKINSGHVLFHGTYQNLSRIIGENEGLS